MTHGVEEHLEHAEHAAHGGPGHPGGPGGPGGVDTHATDRQIAMTMAIVSAVLAWVTMMSHRAHNEALRLQGDANRLQTEADIQHTQATDQWNYYQAKNTRGSQLQSTLTLLELLARGSGDDAARRVAEEKTRMIGQIQRYAEEERKLRADAEAKVERAHALEIEAGRKLEQSYGVHHRGDRFDLAELGVELALVLCSLAVLTKRRAFWFGGIAFGAAGVVVAGSAFLMP